ncbi:ABC1 kinase family protein [Micromonospora sp. NPDC018662]|uniref:ABC1 kinase family protein n=1 Tax=Micromonospora sp. NPDC018662 TaxID=3364238 RepID=UPI0037AE432E
MSLRMFLRALAIVAVASGELARTLPASLVARVTRGRAAAADRRYRGVVRALQRLGPTFVKFGQIAGTRRDALPPALCARLGTLFDDVPPMSPAAADEALRRARAEQPRLSLRSVDRTPLASGSIASVYRAVLDDGTVVALKLKRTDIDDRMRADLRLIEGMARLAARAPKMRGMPIADLIGYLSAAILGQLDFRREAEHSERLRAELAAFPEVTVPALHRGRSASNCLVFEYVPDLDARHAERLAPGVRARLAEVVLAAVNRLFFGAGFVHCDLHPGNLYLTPDARVVILDAGYCVQLPDGVRAAIGEFFARLAAGDGRRCGEIVLASAVDTGTPVDREGFIRAVADLVARTAGPDNDFDMSVFGNGVYDLQQRYGIYAASDFAFPLMSLLVVEGTVRGISPEVDFQRVGGPAPTATR